MSPLLVGSLIIGYFLVLVVISLLTSGKGENKAFFTGNRNSPWYLVAFGMIGASLSGVTFISVPGEVGNSYWYYFQMVLGYVPGYLFIAKVLLPLYYKYNLVSIYSYLEQRFGFWSYKTGAFFFLISRIIGSAFRLFLVAAVLQVAFFDPLGFPFWVSVSVTLLLIWLYTFRGGIRTIVYTDTLQTAFLLLAVILSIKVIVGELSLGFVESIQVLSGDVRSTIFNGEWAHSRNFFKQFFAGAFIAIVMTGLDQDMMQKNLTCRSLPEAQKNMYWFTVVLVFVNLLFLSLGVFLYQYAESRGISLPQRSDQLYPLLAIHYLPIWAGIFFLIGIIAAAYSSADSALTALTTSFCVDLLGLTIESSTTRIRKGIHIGFSILMVAVILLFDALNDQSVINSIFSVASYTYGPLLGLFFVGIFTRWSLKDSFVPLICILAPAFTWLLQKYTPIWIGYTFGFELLLVNGTLTLVGLWFIRKK